MHNLVKSIAVGNGAELAPAFRLPEGKDLTKLDEDEDEGDGPYIYEKHDNGQTQLLHSSNWTIKLWESETSIDFTVEAPEADEIYLGHEPIESEVTKNLALPGSAISDERIFVLHAISECHSEHYQISFRTFQKRSVRLHSSDYYSRTRATITDQSEKRHLSQWDPYERPKDICITLCHSGNPVYTAGPPARERYEEDVDYIENQSLYGDDSDRPVDEDFIHWGLIQQSIPNGPSPAEVVQDRILPDGRTFESWMNPKYYTHDRRWWHRDYIELEMLIKSCVTDYQNKTLWLWRPEKWAMDRRGRYWLSNYWMHSGMVNHVAKKLGMEWKLSATMGGGWLHAYPWDPPSGNYFIINLTEGGGYHYDEEYDRDLDIARSRGLNSQEFYVLDHLYWDRRYWDRRYWGRRYWPGYGYDINTEPIVPDGCAQPAWLEEFDVIHDVTYEDLMAMTKRLIPSGETPSNIYMYSAGSYSGQFVSDWHMQAFREKIKKEYPNIHVHGPAVASRKRMLDQSQWVCQRPTPGELSAQLDRIKIRDSQSGQASTGSDLQVETQPDINGPLKVAVATTTHHYTFKVIDREDEPVEGATIRIWESGEKENELLGQKLFGSWWSGGPMKTDEYGVAKIDTVYDYYEASLVDKGPHIRTNPPSSRGFREIQLEGEVLDMGGQASLDVKFAYSSMDSQTPIVETMTSPGTYSYTLNKDDVPWPHRGPSGNVSYRANATYEGADNVDSGFLETDENVDIRLPGTEESHVISGEYVRTSFLQEPYGRIDGMLTETEVTEEKITVRGWIYDKGDASNIDIKAIVVDWNEYTEESGDFRCESDGILNSDGTFEASFDYTDGIVPGRDYRCTIEAHHSGIETVIDSTTVSTLIANVYVADPHRSSGDYITFDVRMETKGPVDRWTGILYWRAHHTHDYTKERWSGESDTISIGSHGYSSVRFSVKSEWEYDDDSHYFDGREYDYPRNRV